MGHRHTKANGKPITVMISGPNARAREGRLKMGWQGYIRSCQSASSQQIGNIYFNALKYALQHASKYALQYALKYALKHALNYALKYSFKEALK